MGKGARLVALIRGSMFTHRLARGVLHGDVFDADAKGKRPGRVGDPILKSQVDVLDVELYG